MVAPVMHCSRVTTVYVCVEGKFKSWASQNYVLMSPVHSNVVYGLKSNTFTEEMFKIRGDHQTRKGS